MLEDCIKRRNDLSEKIRMLQEEIKALELQEVFIEMKEMNLNSTEAIALLRQFKKEEGERIAAMIKNNEMTEADLDSANFETSGGRTA